MWLLHSSAGLAPDGGSKAGPLITRSVYLPLSLVSRLPILSGSAEGQLRAMQTQSTILPWAKGLPWSLMDPASSAALCSPFQDPASLDPKNTFLGTHLSLSKQRGSLFRLTMFGSNPQPAYELLEVGIGGVCEFFPQSRISRWGQINITRCSHANWCGVDFSSLSSWRPDFRLLVSIGWISFSDKTLSPSRMLAIGSHLITGDKLLAHLVAVSESVVMR